MLKSQLLSEVIAMRSAVSFSVVKIDKFVSSLYSVRL